MILKYAHMCTQEEPSRSYTNFFYTLGPGDPHQSYTNFFILCDPSPSYTNFFIP